MKHVYLLIFILTCNAAFSQVMYMPRTSTMHTPYGNVKTTSYYPVYQNYGFNRGAVSAKYEFTIVFKNDSSLVAKSKIDMSSKRHTLPIKVKKERKIISPADTKEIYRVALSGLKMTGIPADSCWLFQCGKGKINTYSSFAEQGTTYTIAIQDGNSGAIVPLTKKNLEAIVGTPENPKVLKYIEKGKLISAIDLYNSKTIK